ncbi:MAG: Basic proline-rich protein precursor [Myxococcaceae bacterium]|nr:Basic proline-rich protein precursor [Myxococcaceae bacterium]
MPAPDQRVPELIGGVDIRTLPLTALDGFVLSRIDGRSNIGDIVAMTGLAAEQVEPILLKLAQAGAIRLPGSGASESPAAPERTEKPGSDPAPRASRSGTNLPPISSLPPRRRPSYGSAPRKLLSESSISGPPPPDLRSITQRARVSTPSRPRTPVPPTTPTPVAPNTSSLPPREGRALDSAPAREPSATPLPSSAPHNLPFDSGPPTHRLPLIAPADTRDSDATTMGPRAPMISVLPSAAVSAPPARLYDPRELEEAVDLPPERRKQILEVFYRLPTLDYYGVLGVADSADKKEIRAAYFSLSKAFHPDSMFRKELGSYKAKMTAVFQALTEAYETLSKKKAREEYDSYLRSTRSARDAERALATDEVAAADGKVEVPRPPALPQTDYAIPAPTPVPEPPREVSADARRIARELLERRLRGAGTRNAPEPPTPRGGSSAAPAKGSSVPSLPPSTSPIDRQAFARQLSRALIDVGKVTGGADKLTRAVSGARAAFERGDIAGSVQYMARAFSLAPERADLHAEYDKLSRMLAEKLAADYESQAKFEAKQNKWGAAAVSWSKVCEGRPDDAVAHRAAAFALLKAGGDLRGAQKYAQKAVYLAPDDIDGRILLAQTYLTVGLKLNARRELDAAAKLDPSNEMVKNLLKDLKG